MFSEHTGVSQPVVTEHSNLGMSRHHIKIETLLAEVRLLGRLPKELKESLDENQRKETACARRLRRLRGHMSEAQKEELASISVAFKHAKFEEVLADIRAFGRLPRKRSKDSEAALASRLRRVCKDMSEAEERQLANLHIAFERAKFDRVLAKLVVLGRLPKDMRKPLNQNQRSERYFAKRLRFICSQNSESQKH